MPEIITIHVKLDAAVFRRFAVFDAFRVKHKWRGPALLALLPAALAFALRREQSLPVGCALLAAGVGLPLAYFGAFFAQVDAQVRAQRLNKPRAAYTLAFAPEGVYIRDDRSPEAAQLRLSWNKMYAAYRVKGCVYLYAAPNKAYLLPDGQANASPDALWLLLAERLRRCYDKR